MDATPTIKENTRAYYDECLREFTAALLAKEGLARKDPKTVIDAAGRYAAGVTKKREETRDKAASFALGETQ